MMHFKDDVPMGNRIDILQSKIRQIEREIQKAVHRRAELGRDLEQLEGDLKEYRRQFDILVELARTRSEEA